MNDEHKDLMVKENEEAQVAISPFSSLQNFNAATQMAEMLTRADLLPANYRGNTGNLLVAMETANRTNRSLLYVTQNLNIIHGKPGWSAAHCIASINNSSRFEGPIEYEFQGEENTDSHGCRAVATTSEGKVVKGPEVTIMMAKKEGWYSRYKSKWPTMPEVMLMNRAATFFSRLYAPDILAGMSTDEEIYDYVPEEKVINKEPVVKKKVAKKAPKKNDSIEAEFIEESVRDIVDTRPSVNGLRSDYTPDITLNVVDEQPGMNEQMIDDPAPMAEEVPQEVVQQEVQQEVQEQDGFFDAFGNKYNPEIHAGLAGGKPRVNSDGSFRMRRGMGKSTKQQPQEQETYEVIQGNQDPDPITPDFWIGKVKQAKSVDELLILEKDLDGIEDENAKQQKLAMLGERYNELQRSGELVDNT